MKRKKVLFIFIVAVSIMGVYTIFIPRNLEKNVAMSNIEALAYGEGGTIYSAKPVTVSCKLELGGGQFTSSVARICEEEPNSSSCFPYRCGETW